MTDVETRFAHLLEPIRDLAQNWNVNIANELEEYLCEVESITIQFEDSLMLNFAEAALLIQGSACIYSKKVEHLYTLVYQTLNEVVEKKRVAKESSISENGMDADTALESAAVTFLMLGNTLKEVEAKSIMLPSSDGVNGRAPCPTVCNPAPFYLVCPEDLPDRKMHACLLHVSGALLLPNMHFPECLLATISRTFSLATILPCETIRHFESSVGFDNDSDDSSGDAMDGKGWDEVQALDPGSASPRDEEYATEPMTLSAASPTQERRDAPGVHKPSLDPWAPLDPHDPCSALRRPFRRGKMNCAPNPNVLDLAVCLGDLVSEFGRGANDAERCVGDNENADAGSGAYKLHPLHRVHLLPKSKADGIILPLKQPLWAQFELMHAAEMRRRAGKRRQQRLHASKLEHVHLSGTVGDAIQVDQDALTGAMCGEAELYDDENEAPMDFDGNYYNKFEATPTFGGACAAAAGRTSYEELCREQVETCLQASTHCEDDMELFRRVNEWTTRVEPMLRDAFTREHFDIQTYSTRLLANFEPGKRPTRKKQQKTDADHSKIAVFAELAWSHEQYEVCRMFLTALQLANAGNVAIIKDLNEEAPCPLSTHLPYAPSQTPPFTEQRDMIHCLARRC